MGQMQVSTVALLGMGLAGCGSGSGEGEPIGDVEVPRPALCARAGADAVRDVFCAGEARVTSLRQLQDAFNVDYEATNLLGEAMFLGHSTALSGHLVSPINPRVVMRGVAVGADEGTFLAFVRGEQRVELASKDRSRGTLNFYLLSFTQECNGSPSGCRAGDLFTPSIEKGWTSVELRDDEELKDTAEDCRQCHQRGRDTPILLMRELRSPWVHFFQKPLPSGIDIGSIGDPSGGIELGKLYRAAKGDEPYASFTWPAIQASTGNGLELAVERDQPLLFDSAKILRERFPTAPRTEDPGARSATWDREYEAFKRGEHLPLPYYARDAADPEKLAELSATYRRFVSGGLSSIRLPDLSDVFPDDPQVRAEIGLQTEPGASPAEALIQACGSCHNDVLDQTLTRARFSIALSRMDAEELAEAVVRLERGVEEPGVMPPAGARQLDEAGRSRLIEYLRGGSFTDADRDRLDRAAEMGMARPLLDAGADAN